MRSVIPPTSAQTKSYCERRGHNFEPMTNKEHDFYQRDENGKDTILMKSFYCTNCGDSKYNKVGIWENFIPRSKKAREAESELGQQEKPF